MNVSKLKFTFQKSHGFSLIELIVVMGLMFFLTGTFILTLRRSGNVNQLKAAAQELQSEIRGAKNSAMSGELTGTEVNKAFSVELIPSASTYNLRRYPYPEDVVGGGNIGVIIRPIELPNGITIDSVSRNGSPKGKQLIIFNTPFGKGFISDSDTTWTQQSDGSFAPFLANTCTTATITLRNTNNFKIDVIFNCNSGTGVECQSSSVDIGSIQTP